MKQNFFDHSVIKLEISNGKNNRKRPKHLEIKQHTTNSSIDQRGSVKGNKKYIYIELNESENTTCQNLWDTAKAILRRIPIA